MHLARLDLPPAWKYLLLLDLQRADLHLAIPLSLPTYATQTDSPVPRRNEKRELRIDLDYGYTALCVLKSNRKTYCLYVEAFPNSDPQALGKVFHRPPAHPVLSHDNEFLLDITFSR